MGTLKKVAHAPVNGIEMYYEIYGEGAIPLVLIHGGGSTIQTSFSHMIPLLSGDHMIIAVELQAHGRTTDRDLPESFEQDAADVAGLLAQLGVSKANFLGYSNGATTTLHIAFTYPQLVNKIVLVSGAYSREGMIPGFFDGMQNVTMDHMPQPLKDAFLQVTPDNDKLQTMFEKDRERMLKFKDIDEDMLRKIEAVALVISAQHDVILPEHTLKIASLISNAQLVILPGLHGACIGDVCTHQPHSKQVQITAMLVSEFLNE